MGRKGLLDRAVPQLKQYMTEKGGVFTTSEIAEFLGVTASAAYGVLTYMEALDMIQYVKRGRRNLYYLKGAYDEDTLASMLSRAQPPSRPKRRRRAKKGEKKKNSNSEEEAMVNHSPNAPRDMLPALAILGIYQNETSRPKIQPQEKKPVKFVKEQAGTSLYITVRRHGRVKSLPKEARDLSRGDTIYLKDRYLKELDGYKDIERFNTFFAEAEALARGEYGNVFYASMGTNPWEKLYKVTVKRRDDVQAQDAE